MSRKPTVLLCVAMMLPILLMLWRNEPKPKPSPQTKSAATPVPQKKPPLIVEPNFHWEDFSEADIDEFPSYFGHKKLPNSCEVDALVRPGQTIVADVYEARPGEFVVSKMTPTLITKGDGSTAVEVDVDTFGVNVLGSQSQIFAFQKELRPKDVSATGNRTAEGFHTLTMSAELKGDPPKIRLKASGKYTPVPPPQGEVDW